MVLPTVLDVSGPTISAVTCASFERFKLLCLLAALSCNGSAAAIRALTKLQVVLPYLARCVAIVRRWLYHGVE